MEDRTLSASVPNLLTAMLGSLGQIPGVAGIIRQCQKARVQKEIIGKLDKVLAGFEIDPQTAGDAVCALREKINVQAVHGYNNKLAGRAAEITDPFRYIPPRMRRVVKVNGRVPRDYDRRTEAIDPAAFSALLSERRRVLVVAGAGVGKTTFLLRLQLDLLGEALAETPVPVFFQRVSEFVFANKTPLERTSDLLQDLPVLGFSRAKADKVAGALNERGGCATCSTAWTSAIPPEAATAASRTGCLEFLEKTGSWWHAAGNAWRRTRSGFSTPMGPSSGCSWTSSMKKA